MNVIIALAAGVLLVRLGQALYFSGAARSKNAAGAALRSLCDLCVATLAFWAVGGAILSQRANPIFGLAVKQLIGWGGADQLVLVGMLTVLVGSGVVAGSLSERSKFLSVAVTSAAVAGVAVPAALFWAWSGWLRPLGFTDVAGGASVHVTVGAFALVGAAFVGARAGKYNRDGSTSMIPGHNVPLAVAGTVAIIAGFVAYVVAAAHAHAHDPARPPSLLMQAAMNVLLAAAAGGGTAMTFSGIRYGKPDIGLALLGVMGGLVSITAAGGYVGSFAAVIMGAVAGLLVPIASILLDLFVRIDDPGGGVCVHLVGGVWGTLAAGIFMPGSVGQRLGHVLIQLLGALSILALALGLAAATFLALRATGRLRAREADEYDGLDLAEHDIAAYPDFQQTMIKSYHLREA